MLFLQKHWYQLTWLSLVLFPLSILFCFFSLVRKKFYQYGFFKKININTPIIIIGNISVGGTGKTPLVIWLAKFLQSKNYQPGVISRGYGKNSSHNSSLVLADSLATEVGDEPVIIYQHCKCPVIVDADRVRGVNKLVAEHQCDIIISDDGLQHYRLERDVEVCVIDGVRGNGNGFCLPAGPLREPVSRLNSIDAIIVNKPVNNPAKPFKFDHKYKNTYEMSLQESGLVNVYDSSEKKDASSFQGETVHAVAGIGNPEQFFKHLENLGMQVIRHPFPDHYNYQADDLLFTDYPTVMTEKDAVKLWHNNENMAPKMDQYWYLSVSVNVEQSFEEFILKKIEEKNYG
ncbi:MAG: tetraacyldisaccharide 4'-kinase [Acidiferrobacterales bacterium]